MNYDKGIFVCGVEWHATQFMLVVLCNFEFGPSEGYTLNWLEELDKGGFGGIPYGWSFEEWNLFKIVLPLLFGQL